MHYALFIQNFASPMSQFILQPFFCFTSITTIISVVFYSEREKSDKFCSEALLLAWGSFMCRKSTARDPQLYIPSKGSHTQDFYALKKSISQTALHSRRELE